MMEFTMAKKSIAIFALALMVVLGNPLITKACGGGMYYAPLYSRMAVGMHGMTTYTQSGDPLRVRETPGLDGKYLTQLYNGTPLTIIAGSKDVDGLTWWQITTADGKVSGWVAESGEGEYYLTPTK